MKTVAGLQPKSVAVTIYGVPGCGKTTLASFAPDAIVLDCEGGADRVDCQRYAADDWEEGRTRIKTYNELMTALREVYASKFKTVVVDTLGAVEEILTQKILDEANETRSVKVSSLADSKVFNYGRGFETLKSEWSDLAKVFFMLRDSGKNVISIAHEAIEPVENPEGENYNRFSLNIHKKSAPLVIGKMDAVLFAQLEKVLATKSGNKQFAKETGRRVLHTTEKPAFAAKNRFGLPEKIYFDTPDDCKNLWKMMGI